MMRRLGNLERATLVAVALVMFTIAAVGIAGLVRGAGHDSRAHSSQAAVAPSNPVVTPGPEFAPSPTSSAPARGTAPDAIAFARTLAAQLYTWNTATDSRDVVLSHLEAEASDSDDAPGYISDLNSYIPSDDEWAQFSDVTAHETVSIQSVRVPSSWAGIAAKNHLAGGITAVTITGTWTRTGIWAGQKVTDTGPVAFTAFLDCATGARSCTVLRLSAPGKTLS